MRLRRAETLGQDAGHGGLCIDGLHRARHHLVDGVALQRIHRVFAIDMEAAPRDLLRHDRARHGQHDKAVGDGHCQQHRQDGVDVVRETEGEHDGGERRAQHAGQRGGHADQRPQARIAARQDGAEHHAQARAHHQQRRKDPAGRAGAQRDHPDQRLDHQQRERHADGQVVVQQITDDVIAHAQRVRFEITADADRQPAEGRPPHPVDRQAGEQIFGLVERHRQRTRQRAAQQPCDQAGAQRRQGRRGGRQREERTRFEHQHAQEAGHRACDRDRQHAARTPFEQQQFHRQQQRCHRGAEHRRHAGGGAGHQQRLALGGGQLEALREQ